MFHGKTHPQGSTFLSAPSALVGLQTQGFGVAPQFCTAAKEAARDVLFGHQHAVPTAGVAATWWWIEKRAFQWHKMWVYLENLRILRKTLVEPTKSNGVQLTETVISLTNIVIKWYWMVFQPSKIIVPLRTMDLIDIYLTKMSIQQILIWFVHQFDWVCT